MKINRSMLLKYLRKQGLDIFAMMEKVGWNAKKTIQILFKNESLDKFSASVFIRVFGAKESLDIINWRAMNIERPNYKQIFRPQNAN